MENNINNKINLLVEKIKESTNCDNFSDYEKAEIVYKYFINNMAFDNELYERRKNKGRVNLFEEVNNVLDDHKGICSSFSQVYRLILDEMDVKCKVVISDIGDVVANALNIFYDNESEKWYFVDIAEAIYYKRDYFGYGLAQSEEFNQKMLGVMPDALYDAVVGIQKEYEDVEVNETGLNVLPINIYEGYKKGEKRL